MLQILLLTIKIYEIMKKDDELLINVRSLVERINLLDEQERVATINSMEESFKELNYRNGDLVDGFIYKTNDTTHFEDIEANRIVNEDSAYVRDLAESIAKFGNITPVIKNEKEETIDGQRRVRAVRKYGLPNPIRYTYVRGSNIDTVGEINRLQLKWNHKDWLHKYASLKKPDYLQYIKLAKQYEPFVKSRSLRSILMNNRYESFPARIWETGQFKINKERLPEMIKFLNFTEKVFLIGGRSNIFANDRNFQKALYDIFTKTNKLDEERLLYKIQYGFGQLNVRQGHKGYRTALTRLYNSRLAGKIPHMMVESSEEANKEQVTENAEKEMA